MKKTYITPQMEVVVLKDSCTLLAGSVAVTGLDNFDGYDDEIINGNAD